MTLNYNDNDDDEEELEMWIQYENKLGNSMSQ